MLVGARPGKHTLHVHTHTHTHTHAHTLTHQREIELETELTQVTVGTLWSALQELSREILTRRVTLLACGELWRHSLHVDSGCFVVL